MTRRPTLRESEAARRSDFVWIDDALPTGASPQGDGPWNFVGKPEHPVYSGTLALRNTAQGLNQRFFDNAGRKLKVGAGDTLFAYVYIDPAHSPAELMLQWHTSGGWSHRAFWGENVIDWGADGTPERMRMGDLPAIEKMGTAGSAGRQTQAHTRHGHRRLGVHPVRRHGLLGQGRHPDRDSARRTGFRFPDGVG